MNSYIINNIGENIPPFEGRRNSREDYGDIDLVLKRSHDLGETWGELELLYEEGGNTDTAFSCPTPFVEDT